MGQITRTRFGCTKTVEITNAQFLAAADPILIEAVPAVPGKIIFPLVAFLRFDWTADYSGLDAGATMYVTLDVVTPGGNVMALYQSAGGPADLLVAGESVVACFGVDGATTEWVNNGDPVVKLATFQGLPAMLLFSNNGAGALGGGDPLNRFTLETHYMVI